MDAVAIHVGGMTEANVIIIIIIIIMDESAVSAKSVEAATSVSTGGSTISAKNIEKETPFKQTDIFMLLISQSYISIILESPAHRRHSCAVIDHNNHILARRVDIETRSSYIRHLLEVHIQPFAHPLYHDDTFLDFEFSSDKYHVVFILQLHRIWLALHMPTFDNITSSSCDWEEIRNADNHLLALLYQLTFTSTLLDHLVAPSKHDQLLLNRVIDQSVVVASFQLVSQPHYELFLVCIIGLTNST